MLKKRADRYKSEFPRVHEVSKNKPNQQRFKLWTGYDQKLWPPPGNKNDHKHKDT